MKRLMNQEIGPIASSIAKSMNSFSLSVPTRHHSPQTEKKKKFNVLFLHATAKRYHHSTPNSH